MDTSPSNSDEFIGLVLWTVLPQMDDEFIGLVLWTLLPQTAMNSLD